MRDISLDTHETEVSDLSMFPNLRGVEEHKQNVTSLLIEVSSFQGVPINRELLYAHSL